MYTNKGYIVPIILIIILLILAGGFIFSQQDRVDEKIDDSPVQVSTSTDDIINDEDLDIINTPTSTTTTTSTTTATTSDDIQIDIQDEE